MLPPDTISAEYNNDTDLMFPLRVIPQLRNIRGDQWKALIDEILLEDATIVSQSAFTLMMVRLSGCQSCSVDSFRGMRGCTQCARQTIRRFRSTDQEIMLLYEQAKSDLQRHLNQT